MSLINSIFGVLRFNRKNWKAVVLCVLAATIFWFFNSLNKSYSANINFPIAFEYDEGSYVPIVPLPEHVRLNVSGLGWELFRRSTGLRVSPLRISLENPAEVKKIVGASLPPLLSSQLEGLQVNFVITDTVFLNIDPKVIRWVSLGVDSLSRFLKPGFGVSSKVIIQPDSIWVEGPQSLVNALPDQIALVLTSRNIDKPFNDEVEVKLISDLIDRNPPLVNVSFTVDKLIEISDTVFLQIRHIPQHIRSVVKVNDIAYSYTIPVSLVHTISPDSVKAELDLNGFSKGNHQLVPTITGLPEFSQLVRVDTVEINF